jgi:hypothetical protein
VNAQHTQTKPVSVVVAVARFIAAALALAAYLRVIRPWQLRWGATDSEVDRAMPGDEVVQEPTFNATRAITVAAPPDAIWPWIVQIGFRRAGWYAYDWIDNPRWPTLDRIRPWQPSAETIIPALQHVAVGDFYPQGPGESSGLWVRAFERNQWMLWADKQGNATWLWLLDPVDSERTRLITRVRLHYVWTSPWILMNLMLDVGDIVMMRKCMLGIKRRAEAMHAWAFGPRQGAAISSDVLTVATAHVR